jgi:hypothetical protein
MNYSVINNSDNNFLTFFLTFCCTIFPSIPFIFVDIYYALFYQSKISCLESTYFKNLTMRFWLLVNGSISTFSVFFTFFICIIIYSDYIKCISNFFQNTYFIKGYILLKLLFNIIWTIIGTLMFIDIYDTCFSNLKIYICIRISIMFLFIFSSIIKIKKYLFDVDNVSGKKEINNINNINNVNI